jgi:FAD/FMN-containing dehydrogenase
MATTPHDFSALSSQVSGSVVLPGDDGYDEYRHVFNGMIDRRPAGIVRCASSSDVKAAIDCARADGWDVSVYGGGHSVTGSAVCDGGLVIDLRPMHAVEVDGAARTAVVEGGATWGDVDAATTQHGLAVTGGRVPTTGVGGLTLGSGSGWLERTFGLTCDSLRSCEVVLADGTIVRASDDENAELFWGLRGGSGNFGVVTQFEFTLHDIPPLMHGGLLVHAADNGAELLKFWREFMATAPDEVNSGVAFISAPPADFVPEPVRGQPVVGLVVLYVGDPDEGAKVLDPLVTWGPPLMTLVQPMPYLAVQGLLQEANQPGRLNYWTSDFIDLPDEACETFANVANTHQSPFSQSLIAAGGGAVARVPDDAMAFGQRQAPFNIHLINMWADPADNEREIAWVKGFGAAMKPWARQGAYLNYLGDEGSGRVQEAFGAQKFARLQALKTRYDPTNLFRHNQNIPPLPAS